ncbi:hypothetical protein AB6D92_23305 [Vibrio splendidus]
MRISREAEQYILQCQLTALEEQEYENDDHDSIQEPVTVNSLREAKPLLDKGITVVLNGKHLTAKNGRVFAAPAHVINRSVKLGFEEAELVSGAMRVMEHHIAHGSVKHMYRLLQQDAQKSFDDFKEAIKPHTSADDTQYLIAKDLNEIEARAKNFPLITAKQASVLFGEVSAANPSRLVAKLKKEMKLLGFYFGNSRNIQIPAFQFDTERLGVYKPVERLCHIFDGLNDWGVYKWLTTHNDDLECTPAQAISRPELGEDLLYLAGLFKSQSTLRDLTFASEEQDYE